MRTPYFSREEQYKTPFGAVRAGQQVAFRLFLPADCRRAELLLREDQKAEASREFWRTDRWEAEGCWWECILTLSSPGLYFYRFAFDTPFGHTLLTRGRGGKAVMEPDGPPFQLTVYDPGFTTPAWLRGGVMYQIFPDRFCASGQPKEKVPADRYLYSSFEGQPAFTDGPSPLRLNNDYWCGDLKGIQTKLPYLKELGVTCLYLNPIFEAHANHRYNTADYRKIDPLLGSEEDFKALCEAAHAAGIRILLDGVFSHTGSDSRYFNADNRYPPDGAANRPDSPYASWYTFSHYPDAYRCWWGFSTLPEVNETDPAYLEFITGRQGILAYWMQLGADGWRLDVADELPDEFLDALRKAVKQVKPDGMILGEVWEDATAKISYGHRRRYLLGDQLDSVMNYPFMEAVLSFVRDGNARHFMEQVMTVTENYPPPALHTLMNHLGTHDTQRLITALAGEPAAQRDRAWQAAHRLTESQRRRGEQLVKLATLLQYTLPGVPCIYYGDELGMEGYPDPFNRAPMAWNRPPSRSLPAWYRFLGALRHRFPLLQEGRLEPVFAEGDVAAYLRTDGKDGLLVAVNRGDQPRELSLPAYAREPVPLVGSLRERTCLLPPASGVLIAFSL